MQIIGAAALIDSSWSETILEVLGMAGNQLWVLSGTIYVFLQFVCFIALCISIGWYQIWDSVVLQLFSMCFPWQALDGMNCQQRCRQKLYPHSFHVNLKHKASINAQGRKNGCSFVCICILENLVQISPICNHMNKCVPSHGVGC